MKVISVHVQNGVRPKLEDIRERIPTALHFLMRSCWREGHHDRPTFESICETLYSQVSQLDFDLKLPCIAKLSRRSNIDDSCSSAGDQTDFVTSMMRGDIEQTRATNKFLSGFRNVGESLLEYLDPDNDLIDCLKQRHVLTDLEYQQFVMFAANESSSYVEKNREILSEYVSPKIEYCCMDFIDALKNDGQQHVINHIMNAGELLDRVLSQDEIHLINKRMPCLANLIDLDKFGFLDLMVTTNIIASKHKKLIEKLETVPERINELMSILKRRNYKHYRNFKLCLEETNQGNVVDLLENGEVFTVHVKLLKNTNPGATALQLVDVVKFYLNNKSRNLDEFQTLEQISLTAELDKLKTADITFLGNWINSEVDAFVIGHYFLCTSYSSVKRLEQMFVSGRLKDLLESIYRCLNPSNAGSTKVIDEVLIDSNGVLISSKNCQQLHSSGGFAGIWTN